MGGVSVIVCCYNSVKRLPETLNRLAKQKAAHVPWELIIVDNKSTDNTAEFCMAEWNKYSTGVGIKVVREARPGLTFARRRGLHEARYSYAIFCDDDNWLEESYIATAFEVMEADARIGLLGGQSVAISNSPFPDWFEMNKRFYAVGKQAERSGDVTSRGFVWGAGMVLRKEVLDNIYRLGINSRLSDRMGAALSSGGDSEISAWYILAGYRLWYDDRLLFKHYIPRNRLTAGYFSKLRLGLNESTNVLKQYERLIQFVNNRHFGHLNVLFGLYLWFRLQLFTLMRRRADVGYLRDLVQLYTRGLIRYNNDLHRVWNDVSPLLKVRMTRV